VELIHTLLPMLAPEARVVNVSSGYGQLANLAGSAYHDAVANAADLAALQRIAFDPHDAHMASTSVPAYKARQLRDHGAQTNPKL
jgi:hypothetical protein